MNTFLNNNQQFKEGIGEFIILFSELEYNLSCICNALQEDDFQNLKIIMKMTISDKKDKIKHFLRETELFKDWLKINHEIGELNRFRKHIVHGIMDYYIPDDNYITAISKKDDLEYLKITTENLKKQSNRLIDLNTGKMGLSSVFLDKVREIRY